MGRRCPEIDDRDSWVGSCVVEFVLSAGICAAALVLFQHVGGGDIFFPLAI